MVPSNKLPMIESKWLRVNLDLNHVSIASIPEHLVTKYIYSEQIKYFGLLFNQRIAKKP